MLRSWVPLTWGDCLKLVDHWAGKDDNKEQIPPEEVEVGVDHRRCDVGVRDPTLFAVDSIQEARDKCQGDDHHDDGQKLLNQPL